MPSLNEGIWILPLRGRVPETRRLLAAVQKTEPEALVVALLDPDDPAHDELSALLAAAETWVVYTMPFAGATTVEKLNFAIEILPFEGFYGLLASDIVPLTQGWGTALAAACPPMGLSYGDDSIHGIRLPTHPCVSGDLVRALGWWALPEAKHNGVDVCLAQVSSKFGGCAWVPEVKFLHMHPCVKRAPRDELNARADSWRSADDAAYARWLAQGFEETVRRLGGAA